jgi:hypothetical protein
MKKHMSTMRELFDQYITDTQDKDVATNRWLEVKGEIKIYLRRNRRVINGSIFRVLEIANVVNDTTEMNGQGHFRKFVELVEETKLEPCIYVENVWHDNIHMHRILQKNGFQVVDDGAEVMINYFKMI